MTGLAWKIRGAMLLLVGIAGASAWLAINVFGGGGQGWGIAAGLLAAVAIAIALVIETGLVRRINSLRDVIERMYTDGDLTRRVPVQGGDEIAQAAASFNKLIGSFQTDRKSVV